MSVRQMIAGRPFRAVLAVAGAAVIVLAAAIAIPCLDRPRLRRWCGPIGPCSAAPPAGTWST